MEPEVAAQCSQRNITGSFLSQLKPIHTLTQKCYFKVDFIIILPSTPRYLEWVEDLMNHSDYEMSRTNNYL
jgi:hypothetical protein